MIVSAKQYRNRGTGRDTWYGYYAGFTSAFVLSVVRYLDVCEGDVCLDPWNGSGTTTQAAHEWGCHSVGFDINPAMVVVAKSRWVSMADKRRIESTVSELREVVRPCETDTEDPLSIWFTPAPCREYRHLVREIAQRDGLQNVHDPTQLADLISPTGAFCLVALFRSVRGALKGFVASNPTWIKKPSRASRVRRSRHAIRESFQSEINAMLQQFDPHHACRFNLHPLNRIETGDSRALPLSGASVDCVVTSPPYFTRIDYAITTLPELALLGANSDVIDAGIRRLMLGTTTVPKAVPIPSSSWGETALTSLQLIYEHPSKAAKSYYYKNIASYLDGLSRSLQELARVMREKRHVALVVQDSYFKDVHLDLARIVCEMGEHTGFSTKDVFPLHSGRTLGAINKRSRRYRASSGATESLVVLTRKSL